MQTNETLSVVKINILCQKCFTSFIKEKDRSVIFSVCKEKTYLNDIQILNFGLWYITIRKVELSSLFINPNNQSVNGMPAPLEYHGIFACILMKKGYYVDRRVGVGLYKFLWHGHLASSVSPTKY